MNIQIAAIAMAGQYEVGFAETPAQFRQTVAALEARGIRVLDGWLVYDIETLAQARARLEGQSFCALLVCVGTWSEDHHLLELMHAHPKPVILHAYPGVETGSLCGVQQIGSVFRDIGFRRFSYVFGEAGSPETTEKILGELQVCGLEAVMKHTRFASIGGRCGGMTETAFDEFELLQKVGAQVMNIDESELLQAVAEAPESVASELLGEMKRRFSKIYSSDEQLLESLRYYLAMKQLAERYALSGFAIKCYTKYMGKVCLGGALLAEEGIVSACEGDVNNAVMMKILQTLSGGCVNCTDILQPDADANTILFAHCGNTGFSLAPSAEDVELCPVRIMEQGVCGRFVCKPGPVTAVDLVGHGGTLRMSILTGQVVPSAMEFPGTPMKIRMKRPVLDLCEEITLQGCGHHWMVCYGDYARPLRKYCQNAGITLIDLDGPSAPGR